jgi:hypothetical protein
MSDDSELLPRELWLDPLCFEMPEKKSVKFSLMVQCVSKICLSKICLHWFNTKLESIFIIAPAALEFDA